MNEKNMTDLLAQIEEDAFFTKEIRTAANENNLDDFLIIFSKKFAELLLTRMGRNKELSNRFQNDAEFRHTLLKNALLKRIASIKYATAA